MLQLLVGRGCRDEQAMTIPGCQTTNDACAGDGATANRDNILKLSFEDTG